MKCMNVLRVQTLLQKESDVIMKNAILASTNNAQKDGISHRHIGNVQPVTLIGILVGNPLVAL